MLPTSEELVSYIKKEKIVNFTKIAKKFKISNHIVPDLLVPIIRNRRVRIKKIGSSKIVEIVSK